FSWHEPLGTSAAAGTSWAPAQRVQRYPVGRAAASRVARRGARSLCSQVFRAQTFKENAMTIKVGDRLPPGTLQEYHEVASDGCSVGPNPVDMEKFTRGRKVVIFGLPGAFTPTCSAKHVPSYVANYDALKRKGVDEVICMSVNDPFVMGAWAKDQKTAGKVRMMGDGSGTYTKALGLELDLNARGLGTR